MTKASHLENEDYIFVKELENFVRVLETTLVGSFSVSIIFEFNGDEYQLICNRNKEFMHECKRAEKVFS